MAHDLVTVTVYLRVTNGRRLIAAARKQAAADGMTTLGRNLSAREAAQYLVDPGALPGAAVLESASSYTGAV